MPGLCCFRLSALAKQKHFEKGRRNSHLFASGLFLVQYSPVFFSGSERVYISSRIYGLNTSAVFQWCQDDSQWREISSHCVTRVGMGEQSFEWPVGFLKTLLLLRTSFGKWGLRTKWEMVDTMVEDICTFDQWNDGRRQSIHL